MGFCKDFVWGAATAAYQIEGAVDTDGRGKSIWDVFSHRDGKIYKNSNGDIACDHYNRYKEDVALMAQAGLKAYRMSISWSRVIPDGDGAVNEKGIKFYSDLVDELIANGITPYITLYHWDYPQALHQRGGWLNPQSSDWFEYYTRVVVSALGDRVKNWIPLNEPQVDMSCGHVDGVHAPGQSLPRCEQLQMGHNMLLAHGKAVKAIRELCKDAKVGTAHAGAGAYPLDNTPESIEAAKRKIFTCAVDSDPLMCIGWWADAMFLGKYPDMSHVPGFSEDMPNIAPGDMEIISQPLDFLGFNYYRGTRFSKDDSCPHGIRAYEFPDGYPKSMMEWPITPDGIYYAAKFVYERYNMPLMITENGIAINDWEALDGGVHDPNRIDYVHKYLIALKRAVDEGCDIRGYFYWSFMDNYEWSWGYRPRFGLVYVDYETQKRIPKDSFYWYKDVIAQNGENL